MILRALLHYYENLVDEGKVVAACGYEMKQIPFVIVLNEKGRFSDIQDTRGCDGEHGRGRFFAVPASVKRTNGVAANLLWDTANYVLGFTGDTGQVGSIKARKRIQEQQLCFINQIKELYPSSAHDKGMQAVVAFLETADFDPVYSHPLWKEIAGTKSYISFRLEGDAFLVCQRPAVVDSVASKVGSNGKESESVCLVTGVKEVPVRVHPTIKGIRNAQVTGAKMVSFSLPAFRFFRKQQGLNAPIGERTASAYTRALNSLLDKRSQQSLQVCGNTIVFWGEKRHPFERILHGLLTEPSSELTKVSGKLQFSRLNPEAEDNLAHTPFYVLGLKPNSARLAVRLWQVSSVKDMMSNVLRLFDECEIVHGPNQPAHLSLFRLLTAAAPSGKAEKVLSSLAWEIIKSIMSGEPFPRVLLDSLVRRCRVDRMVTYHRAALIRAVLARDAGRARGCGVSVSLDEDSVIPGYLLGRLFGIIERMQVVAMRGANNTIRDTYFAIAFCCPSAVFPHLQKVAKRLLNMVEKDLAFRFEKQMSDVLSVLPEYPRALCLHDQAYFAIGYYHQKEFYWGETKHRGQTDE